VTIRQHVRKLRIRMARELLISRPDQLIKEVAAGVGYCRRSHRTFLNAFRAETGMSPSRYQHQTRQRPLKVETA
jgi:AraC-like DNA-binding protein